MPWKRLSGGSSAFTNFTWPGVGGGSGRGISLSTRRFRETAESDSSLDGALRIGLKADALGR